MRVLAVVGLTREARIVAGPKVVAVAGGGDERALEQRIAAALKGDIGGVISIGIAGALDASLAVGDAVVATGVAGEADVWSADAAWAGRLAALLPEARRGAVAGSGRMAVDAAAKAALREATGALCVDMESHVAAAAARVAGLPFAAVRIVSDAADRALPKAAQAGMKPDGGMDIAGVLKALAADPRQLPALIRTGREAETAFRALASVRGRLGPTLGLGDV